MNIENKHRPQLIITFNKLKSKGLFAGYKDYSEWEKRNEPKKNEKPRQNKKV